MRKGWGMRDRLAFEPDRTRGSPPLRRIQISGAELRTRRPVSKYASKQEPGHCDQYFLDFQESAVLW